jgi:hypothetical protein
MAMPEITLELAVGDVVVIGNRTLTVIDIEGSEVHFRVDDDLSALPLDLENHEPSPSASNPPRPKAK